MRIIFDIDTDNASMDDDLSKAEEITRILREAAKKIGDQGSSGYKLFDVNGNSIGTVEVQS